MRKALSGGGEAKAGDRPLKEVLGWEDEKEEEEEVPPAVPCTQMESTLLLRRRQSVRSSCTL